MPIRFALLIVFPRPGREGSVKTLVLTGGGVLMHATGVDILAFLAALSSAAFYAFVLKGFPLSFKSLF